MMLQFVGYVRLKILKLFNPKHLYQYVLPVIPDTRLFDMLVTINLTAALRWSFLTKEMSLNYFGVVGFTTSIKFIE